ncbi:MAG: hypothetical protein WD035_04220 [Balneolaceae bacterium]
MKLKLLATTLLLVFWLGSCVQERQRPNVNYTMGDPAESGSRYPYLTTDENGKVFMSWLSIIDENMVALIYSSFEGRNWSEAQTVLIDHNFFINWADFPSVVTKEGAPVAFHWLRKIQGGPYAYEIRVAFQGDDGRWDRIITPHEDGTPTEHGFVSMIALDTDRVLAVWLDGRETAGREHGEYENMDQSMTIRSAEITREGTISRKRVIDSTVCDCCPTDLVATPDGALAVYRNRSEGEVRDIAISRYDFETGQWSDPQIVHDDGWQIGACPVNGPRIDVLGDRAAVSWFTAADGEERVMLAQSTDGGRSFEQPVRIDNGNSMGRVDVKFRDTGALYVSWLDQDEKFGRIYLREISPAGELHPPVLMGNTEKGRGSGFPRMAVSENGIIFGWTQTDPFIHARNAYYPFQIRD